MAITLGDAVIWLRANSTQLDQGLSQADTQAKGWVGSLGTALSVGIAGALTAAVGGVLALAGAALAAGDAFDSSFDTLEVRTGATGPVLESLKESFREVFTSVPTDAGKASAVIALLNQKLDVTDETLVGLSKNLLEASRLMGEDAASNTAALTGLVQNWGVENSEASGTLEKLFVASQQSGVGLGALTTTVTTLGPTLRVLGFNLDESIALIATLEKNGVNAELAFVGMRSAAAKLADSGKPVKEGLLEIFTAIQSTTDETEAFALASDAFGARAGPELVSAIRDGKFAFDDMLLAMEGAEGAILDTASSTADFSERFTIMKNTALAALEPLGLKLLDVVNILFDRFAPAANAAFAALGAFLGSESFMLMVDSLVNGLTSIWNAVQLLVTGEFSGGIFGLTEDDPVILALFTLRDTFIALATWFTTVGIPAFMLFTLWLSTNLQPTLTQLGDFWTTVFLPALQQLGVWLQVEIMPLLAQLVTWLGVNLPIAAQALADFWNNVLLPTLITYWTWVVTVLFPMLGQLWDWLQVTVPAALQTLATFWQTVLQPAIAAVWSWITTVLLPLLSELWTWLQVTVPAALQTLTTFWQTVLLPALLAVWTWMSTVLFPFLTAIATFMSVTFGLAVTVLAGLWQNILLPALTAVWAFFDANVLPILKSVGDYLSLTLAPLLAGITSFINFSFLVALNALTSAFNAISTAIQGVTGWIGDMAAKLAAIQIPDWLTPGSPTPFELGLLGVADALDAVGGAIPDLTGGLALNPLPGAATAGATAGAAAAGATLIFNIDARGSTLTEREFEASVRRIFDEVSRRTDAITRIGVTT